MQSVDAFDRDVSASRDRQMRAPMRLSMLPSATISGSQEALTMVVRPMASVAAMSRFSVPVWLG